MLLHIAFIRFLFKKNKTKESLCWSFVITFNENISLFVAIT